jgi:hypothetical protein
MKDSKKLVASLWSFAAGALFGALTVFVPLGSMAASASRPEASAPRRAPVSIIPAAAPSGASAASTESAASAPISGAKDARKSHSSAARHGSERHCELDLQLD